MTRSELIRLSYVVLQTAEEENIKIESPEMLLLFALVSDPRSNLSKLQSRISSIIRLCASSIGYEEWKSVKNNRRDYWVERLNDRMGFVSNQKADEDAQMAMIAKERRFYIQILDKFSKYTAVP